MCSDAEGFDCICLGFGTADILLPLQHSGGENNCYVLC